MWWHWYPLKKEKIQCVLVKPASHWPIIKESEAPQSVVRLDEICSDYFPPIVSISLPDRRTKSHIGNRKLSPIVGPKSDMADYRRFPPIIIFPRRKFSHCPIFHPIFHPTLRSSDQSGNGFRWVLVISHCKTCSSLLFEFMLYFTLDTNFHLMNRFINTLYFFKPMFMNRFT